MDTLKQIIQKCRDRKNRTLHQRKTIVLPAGYSAYPYHFRVYYAHGQSALLHDLEEADISFMPIGAEPFDRAPGDWTRMDNYRDRVNNRQDTQSWLPRWYASSGIGIYTGKTSAGKGGNWHDIEFTYQAVLDAPDTVSACLEALIFAVVNPLVTLTKEGGLRFSCRVTDYIHPGTLEAKHYIYKHRPTPTDPKHREVYVQVKGEMDYSVWDSRYEILMGSLLQPPVISSDALFALLRFFKSVLHQAADGSVDETLRAYEPKTFDDEDIINPLQMYEGDRSVPEKVCAVRKEELSPLAIKRPKSVLTKHLYSEPEPFDIEKVLASDARVIGISTGLRSPAEYREIERLFLQKHPLYLNLPTIPYCKAADDFWAAEGYSIGVYWQPDTNAEVIKDVPRDELLKSPFERGNLCIDPKRWQGISLKGGNANKILCPKCPVHEACEVHGYQSQMNQIANSDICISEYKEFGTRQTLLNPTWEYSADSFFRDKKRIGVLASMYASDLFAECTLDIHWIEDWITYWSGSILGDFAHALLNAVRVNEDNRRGYLVERLRSVVKAFAGAEEILKEQMTQINVASGDSDACIGMSVKDAMAFGFIDITSPKSMEVFTGQRTLQEDCGTYWDMLKRFFEHYRRDADAPMYLDGDVLRFWVPPVLHPGVEKLVILSPTVSEDHLRRVFKDEKVEVYDLGTQAALTGNQVYQLRGEAHSPHSLLNYDLSWDALGFSSVGTRFATGIHREVERKSEMQHALVLHDDMDKVLVKTLKNKNTRSVSFSKDIPKSANNFSTALENSDVIWVFGTPYWTPDLIWKHARIVYSDDVEPLDYNVSLNPYTFKDERLQRFADQYSVQGLMGMLSYAGLTGSNKTIVLNTALRVPGITDAPETTLFDWEDFELAGGLDRLSETIAQREAYEVEYAEMDASWTRERVEFLLGVSASQANRILKRLRGGRRARVLLEVQILNLLTDGEKTTAALVDAVQGDPGAVRNALTKLVKQSDIVRVQRGVYDLS